MGGGGDPFAGASSPFSAPPSPSPSGDPFAPIGSASGGETSDPFGRAPSRQTSSPSVPSGPAVVVNPPAGPGQWVLRTADGEELVEVAELRDRIKAGRVKPDDLCAPAGESLKPAREHGALEVAFGNRTVAAEKPRVAGARASGGLSLPKPAIAAVVAVVVGVGGVFGALKFMPELFEKQTEAGVNPLRRARPVWQRQFPDVEGTAQEHLVEGRKQMQLDTAAGYRKADDELRQALLLDVGNVAAIAAWAENFASLPTARADLEGSTLAREAVEFGLKKEPDNAELIRAQAALKLVLGDVDDAQRLLKRAKELAPDDIDTLMLLARSNLDRSPGDALAIVQREVRARKPDLRAAYTLEGAAQRRLGAFKEAREMLEARLVSDSANVGALKEVAKLELDLGNADAALKALAKLLDAEDKDVEAWLLRAKITYQIKGGAEAQKVADAQLQEVLKKHEGAAGDLLLAVLAHATFVKTALGDLDGAIALGERARATDPSYPAALYTLGRAYAAKGDLDNAKRTLEQAVRATEQRDQFYEPLVRAELARVQARAGDEQNAVRNNEKVIDYDPRNIRAHFSLAATFMKNNKASQAMTIMRRAFANDPNWERDRRVPTDYPTPADDLIAFADVFKNAPIDADKDESLAAQRAAAEGMIRFHAGQVREAAGLFATALKLDRNNDTALLYQGIMDLEAGRLQDARRRLRQAVETGGRHPITRLYAARADHLAGDIEGARKQLLDLVETEPTLVQARYSLGMVLRSQKLEAQARDELRAVVKQDPDYLPAKQALADR
jgi:tetratricopeptide (TPR) repeat protein